MGWIISHSLLDFHCSLGKDYVVLIIILRIWRCLFIILEVNVIRAICTKTLNVEFLFFFNEIFIVRVGSYVMHLRMHTSITLMVWLSILCRLQLTISYIWYNAFKFLTRNLMLALIYWREIIVSITLALFTIVFVLIK